MIAGIAAFAAAVIFAFNRPVERVIKERVAAGS